MEAKKQRIHVDTTFVIALIDKEDDYHSTAEHSFSKIAENSKMYTLAISNPVLGEVLSKVLGGKLPVDKLEMLKTNYLKRVECDFPSFSNEAWKVKKRLDEEDKLGENNDHIILSIAILDPLCTIFLTNDRKIITQHEVIRRVARSFRGEDGCALSVREALERSKNQIP
jgi:predicted nucleic acid-binding protein